MKFLIDQNLPVLLADWLCERGHEAEHVRRLGLDRQDDHVILAAAQERRAVVISKDGDFAGGGAEKPLVPVIWVRIGNTTNHRLIAAWEKVWPDVHQALVAGERLVEVNPPHE